MLITKDEQIVDKLASLLEKSEGAFLKRDYKKIAKEYLTEQRATEQIELFISEVNKNSQFDFKNKKLLEIGAGVGTFLITARKKYGINAVGIEPSEAEFSPFNEISLALLNENNYPANAIIKGHAECLPFEENSFNLVYSTNVIEHVQDPEKVLIESLRVLKAGGFLQFVIPNYFSFWEGHYEIFWPCITNKFIARMYTKLVGQKPDYIDTLQLVTPYYLKKILKDIPYKIKIIGWGQDIFMKRLACGSYTDWASLYKIRWIVHLAQKLKLASYAADLLNLFEMYTPIVLTIKKLD